MNTVADADAVRARDPIDRELDTLLASFETSYTWNYGTVKQGLRDLYEKAKREQWNGTSQLAWDTDVDPARGILPEETNPLKDFAPYQKLNEKERVRLRHGQVALQL